MAGEGKIFTTPRNGIDFPFYQAAIDAPPPYDLPQSWFTTGRWRLQGMGSADANPFVAEVVLPPQIQIINQDDLRAIDRAQDLTIRWNPDGYGDADVISVNLLGVGSAPHTQCALPRSRRYGERHYSCPVVEGFCPSG
jgi:hypothetical protein